MGRYVLMVHSNPTDGRDADYNHWYDHIHLDEVLQVQGFKAAQRFEQHGEAVAGTARHRYLAIYELETDDPQNALDALQAAAAGSMNISDALDVTDVSAVLYSPLGERLEVRKANEA